MFRARILFVLLLGLAGCTANTFRPADFYRRTLHLVPPTTELNSPEFEYQLDRRTHSRLTYYNAAEILENGSETFPAILDALQAAQLEINISTYTFAADNLGKKFLTELTAAARRGVRVRLIYDIFGSPEIRRRDFTEFIAAGGEVRAFNPWWNWTLCRANNRNHSKIVVVDNRVAFIGGLNISDQYDGDAWRDFMMKIVGEAVPEINRVFRAIWKQSGIGWFGKRLPLIGVATLKNISELPLKPFRRREEKLPTVSPPDNLLPIRVVEQVPDRWQNDMLNMLEMAITGAKQKILICSPYFIPPPRLFNALIAAAKRGVEVIVLTQGKSDIRQIPPLSAEPVRELEKLGAQVYAYSRDVLHGKYVVIDEKWMTVGSANFDPRSMILNYETNVAISDPELAREFEELFRMDIARSLRFFEYFSALKPSPFYWRILKNQF